jgi:hypothetical protein
VQSSTSKGEIAEVVYRRAEKHSETTGRSLTQFCGWIRDHQKRSLSKSKADLDKKVARMYLRYTGLPDTSRKTLWYRK